MAVVLARIYSGVAAAILVWSSLTGAADAKDKINDDLFVFNHVSCTGAKNEIRIVVVGVKQAVGLITADLYPNNQEAFLHGAGRVKKVTYAAKEPVTRFCMTVPDTGEYALAVYQDKNANGQFDKNPFGLPAEPWGISQNPKVRFAPPTVDEALFAVGPDGAKVEIDLN